MLKNLEGVQKMLQMVQQFLGTKNATYVMKVWELPEVQYSMKFGSNFWQDVPIFNSILNWSVYII